MDIKKTQLAGFIFTVALGTLLHFAYDLSGENAFVGAFSAVNESLWEHLKLLTVPMLIFGVYEYFAFGRKSGNFMLVRFLSILLGTAFIIGAFYFYTGILDRNYLIIDILIFVAAVFIAYRFSSVMLESGKLRTENGRTVGAAGLALIILFTVVFTFRPPEAGIFTDPHTGVAGIPKR